MSEIKSGFTRSSIVGFSWNFARRICKWTSWKMQLVFLDRYLIVNYRYATFSAAKLYVLYRHIFSIKDSYVFINHLQWYWIKNYVFDWFIRLIIIKVFCFLCHGNSACSSLIGSERFFFSSHKKARGRESGCQNSIKN